MANRNAQNIVANFIEALEGVVATTHRITGEGVVVSTTTHRVARTRKGARFIYFVQRRNGGRWLNDRRFIDIDSDGAFSAGLEAYVEAARAA